MGGFGMGGGGGGIPIPIPAGVGGGGALIILLIVLALQFFGGGGGTGGLGGLTGQSGAEPGTLGRPVEQRRHGRVHGRRAQRHQRPVGGHVPALGPAVHRGRRSCCSPAGRSPACGAASSQTGPFYCPADQKVYLDTDFFKELSDRFGAPGDFAQAYVIAHEVGHHVQTLTGIEGQVRELQQQDPSRQNELSVKMELQADCLAGVWAQSVYQAGDLEAGRPRGGPRRRGRGGRRPDPGERRRRRQPGDMDPRLRRAAVAVVQHGLQVRRPGRLRHVRRLTRRRPRARPERAHSVECPRAGSSTAEQVTLNH